MIILDIDIEDLTDLIEAFDLTISFLSDIALRAFLRNLYEHYSSGFILMNATQSMINSEHQNFICA